MLWNLYDKLSFTWQNIYCSCFIFKSVYRNNQFLYKARHYKMYTLNGTYQFVNTIFQLVVYKWICRLKINSRSRTVLTISLSNFKILTTKKLTLMPLFAKSRIFLYLAKRWKCMCNLYFLIIYYDKHILLDSSQNLLLNIQMYNMSSLHKYNSNGLIKLIKTRKIYLQNVEGTSLIKHSSR
jgi:hypothetical protein